MAPGTYGAGGFWFAKRWIGTIPLNSSVYNKFGLCILQTAQNEAAVVKDASCTIFALDIEIIDLTWTSG